MRIRWVDLNVKEKIAIISALAAFALGWALTIAGFCIPPIGEVADSVLWILGQALIYAASVFGIAGYFNVESIKLRQDMDRHLQEMERLQIEREKLRHGYDEGEIPREHEQ